MIGIMPSPSVRELLPLGDRILIEVGVLRSCPAGALYRCRSRYVSGVAVHDADCPAFHAAVRWQTRRSRQQAAC